MKQLPLIVLLVFAGWLNTAHAQSSAPPQAEHLRVTGTLLPSEEQQRDDVVAVTIFVQDQPRLFRVGKVEGLNSAEREQAVAEGALLQEVRFDGPDAVMRRLEKTDQTGKLLIIDGQLDATARRFHVTAVEEAK
jgi:hypothetical protein